MPYCGCHGQQLHREVSWQHWWIFCTLPRHKTKRNFFSSFLQLIAEISQSLLASVSLHINFSTVLGFVLTWVSHSRHSSPDLQVSYCIFICKCTERCTGSQLWSQLSISWLCATQQEEEKATPLICGLVIQMGKEKRKSFSWGELLRRTKTL